MLEIVVPAGEGEVVGGGLFEGLAGGGAGFEVEVGVDELGVDTGVGGAAIVFAGVAAAFVELPDDIAEPPQPETRIAQNASAKIPMNAREGKRIS